MRKLLVAALTVLALAVFAAGPAFAGHTQFKFRRGEVR